MEENKKRGYALLIPLFGILALIFGVLAMFFSVALGFPGYGAYIFGFPAIILGILTVIRGNVKWKIIGLIGTIFALIGIFMLTAYISINKCDECGCLRQAKNAKISYAMSDIKTIAESIFFNVNDYSSLCSSNNSLNYSADDKLKSIVDRITVCGGSIPKCFASEKKYCISSTLNDGSPICIDSSGQGKSVCSSVDSICH